MLAGRLGSLSKSFSTLSLASTRTSFGAPIFNTGLFTQPKDESLFVPKCFMASQKKKDLQSKSKADMKQKMKQKNAEKEKNRLKLKEKKKKEQAAAQAIADANSKAERAAAEKTGLLEEKSTKEESEPEKRHILSPEELAAEVRAKVAKLVANAPPPSPSVFQLIRQGKLTQQEVVERIAQIPIQELEVAKGPQLKQPKKMGNGKHKVRSPYWKPPPTSPYFAPVLEGLNRPFELRKAQILAQSEMEGRTPEEVEDIIEKSEKADYFATHHRRSNFVWVTKLFTDKTEQPQEPVQAKHRG